MRKLLLASTAMLGCMTAAHAADNGFYLGAGVSKAEIDDIFGSDRDFDFDDTAWKAIVGFRPIDLFAVEANYMDLGSESSTIGDVDAKAFGAFALGYLPLPVPFVDVYGKAGMVRWEVEGSSRGNLFRVDDDGTEFAYGAGAQLNFGSLSARLEWEKFDIDNTDGLNLYTLGLTWTLL